MKDKIKKNTIKFNIMEQFILVITIILCIVWIFQVSLYGVIFEKLQTKNLEYVNNKINSNYSSINYEDYVALSKEFSCNIIIFNKNDNGMSIIFTSSNAYKQSELDKISKNLVTKLNDKLYVKYAEYDNNNNKSITIGSVIDNNSNLIYIYVNSTVSITTTSQQINTMLFLAIAIFSFFIAILVSFYIARNISRPIKKLSEDAKSITKGNTNIEFCEDEFDEIAQLSDSLNYAIGEMKKSENIQREVIQNVSHELKTPLTMIKSYTEILCSGAILQEDKKIKYLNVIKDECDKLEYLMNDMLDLSKLQAHTMNFNISDYNLSDALSKFEQYYKNKFTNFKFAFNILPNVVIKADNKRMDQVITNFLNNAINYSQNIKEITVNLVENSYNYRVEIIDKGIGISKEDIDKIFDRHFRSTSAKRAVTGSGIGLTIVKQILEYHNFGFGVESELGKGSKFYFEVPK